MNAIAPFLAEYGLFLLKLLTLVFAVALAALLLGVVVLRVRRMAGGGGTGRGPGDEGRIEIVRYNKRLEKMRQSVAFATLAPAERQQALKEERTREKAEAKAAKRAAKLAAKQRDPDGESEGGGTADRRARLFVLDFDGDIRASAVEKLRRELTVVLSEAGEADEIVLRLDSGGGAVTGYGLGASQLDRVRRRGVPLTVCVDKVAASGGYMMACVADRLIAAPFAMLGSIGVIAQIPNFHRLLKELNVDVELLTAGKYKRTLTLFGENTDAGREKLRQDLERIHAQFKTYVAEHRPMLDIERVSTGEVWSGQDLLDLHLVDELGTSDDYLSRASEEREVLLIGYKAKKKGLMARFGAELEEAADRLLLRWAERLVRDRFS